MRTKSMFTKDVDQTKKEEDKTKRQPNVKKGLVALATVGIGMGIYGYIQGQKRGYWRGVKDGMLYSNNQFLEAAKQLAEANKESKGE